MLDLRPAETDDVLTVFDFMQTCYRQTYVGCDALRNGALDVIRTEDTERQFNTDNTNDVTAWARAFGTGVTGTERGGLYIVGSLRPSDGATKEPLVAFAAVRHDSLYGNPLTSSRGMLYETDLYELDVGARCRGRGIGTALMFACVEHMRDLYGSDAEMLLDVSAQNTRARTWYQRLGWRDTGGEAQGDWGQGLILPLVEMEVSVDGLYRELATHNPWLSELDVF